jgi:hypothetical protein
MKALCVLIALMFSSLALADDAPASHGRPALAGYCTQFYRNLMSEMQQALSCEKPITPQQCDEIDRPLRADLAKKRHDFELWRLYSIDVLSDDSTEFLRGVAEANADFAYMNDPTSHPIHLPPSASEEDREKAIKAAAAADPRMQAIRARSITCSRGPPL